MAKREKTSVDLNLTSMMDVVFQLIIFFILVTNFAAADLPELNVPKPNHSRARPTEEGISRVINIVPDKHRQGMADYVLIADHEIPLPRVAEVTSMLVEEKQRVEALQVSLRVDRTLHYDQVQPVMKAITDAGISKINLMALVQPNEPKD